MQSKPSRPSSASWSSSRNSIEGLAIPCARRRCRVRTSRECCATDKGKGHAEWPPQRYVRARPTARSLSSQSNGVGLRRSSLLPEGRRTQARASGMRNGPALRRPGRLLSLSRKLEGAAFGVAPAAHKVIIDHACCLAEGIDDRGPAKSKTAGL